MDPAALAPQTAWDWVRIAVGTLLFLLPGLAAADRFLPHLAVRWALAPVFSATLYPLAAILLDSVGVPVRPATTAILGLTLTALLAQPRVLGWLARRGVA